MTQKIRRERILALLAEQGFATAKELEQVLGISAATVHRDLAALEGQHLVKRSWGGVESVEGERVPPLPLRYDFRKREKRHIGLAAAELVEDGDTVFLDGSTTAESMAPYLAQKKNLTVLTNNLHLAVFLGEAAVDVICLGGRITERPFMLSGDDTVETTMKYRADKAFFSTGCFSRRGLVGSGGYHLLHRVMLQNARRAYYLADASKEAEDFPLVLCDFSALAGVITDCAFPEETVAAFGREKFFSVK